MKTAVLLLAALLVYGGTFAVQYARLQKAEAALAELERELAEWKDAAARWQALYEQARQGGEALAAQAQSCLDRAARAEAEADEWRQLLEAAESREMDATERREVPDDATRRRLFDALDRPL